jgi:tRNA dimethylallyltransferase
MKKVIIVAGPTASGKTKLSIELAKKFNLEIINGDSVQALKKLDIGSAKIQEEEKEGIKHHLLDILEPTLKYSVFDFQRDARKIIDETDEVKIICGGTGLYIKACVCNYEFNEGKREQSFTDKYSNHSNEELYKILEGLDSKAAAILHPNNRRRVLRAIEIVETSNDLKSNRNKKDEYLYEPLILFLNPNREELYSHINQRVDEMIKNGLEKEVHDLYLENIIVDAIGYKEFYPYFKGEITLEEVIYNIKINTRHFAKRQLTFFKNQLNLNFIDVDYNDFSKSISKAFNLVEEFLYGKN